MKLVGADALLASGHESKSLEPYIKFDVATFHYRLGGYGEILPAFSGMTTPNAWLLGRVMLASGAAMGAHRFTVPAKLFQVFAGLIRGLKMGFLEHALNL
jgi:hypothetical protein